MPLQPVARQSVADAVFDQLLDNVLSGEIEAGEELPAERTLTAALGVNRQAVREALQRLASTGVVQIRHGGRTRVNDFRHTAGMDLLPRLLLTADGGVDVTVAAAIMELRSCLGPEVAARCAGRADDERRSAVGQLVEEMAGRSDDDAALVELDLRFWDALVDGAGNIAYRLAFNGLRRTYEPLAQLLTETLRDELRDHAGRRVIASAVFAGDGPAAAAAARRLLGRGEAAVHVLLQGIADAQEATS